jgi:N-acetylmuramic acid 6-phosphate etherase
MSPAPDFLDPRITERRNPRTTRIDIASSGEIVDLMYGEDRLVADAVYRERDRLAAAIDLAVEAMERGGRLVYVGAGTSGRLGVLDATECPPTFGTPPEMVVGVIAGGLPALTRSQEGAEDDVGAGAAAMDEHAVGATDLVVGVAASGTTPYVRAALTRAAELGASTGLVTCAKPPDELRSLCDVVIAVRAGPEVLTGSTRLKAGTATKMVLNTISTGAMIRMGKAFGNLMVDLMALSEKLVDRGERMVMEAAGATRQVARRTIEEAGGSVKLAIVMALKGVDAAEGERLLAEAGGVVRNVVGDPPSVVEGEGRG